MDCDFSLRETVTKKREWLAVLIRPSGETQPLKGVGCLLLVCLKVDDL